MKDDALLLALLAVTEEWEPKRVYEHAVRIHHQLQKNGINLDRPTYDRLTAVLDTLRDTPLMQRLDALWYTVGLQETRQREMQDALNSYLVAQSLGLDTSQTPLPRLLPIRLYVSRSDWNAAAGIAAAATDVAERIGFHGQSALTRETGSWFVSWFSKSREALTQPQVMDRLKKVERAIDLQALDTPQAVVDEKLSQSVARLMEAAKLEPNMVLQLGSLLFVKHTDAVHGPCIFARTLTQREMMAIEANPGMLRDPVGVLKALDDIRRDEPKQLTE